MVRSLSLAGIGYFRGKSEIETRVPTWLIDFAPVWAIVALGVYMLSALIIGVIQFEDHPEAAKELEQQVMEAKSEMKKRGIIDEK